MDRAFQGPGKLHNGGGGWETGRCFCEVDHLLAEVYTPGRGKFSGRSHHGRFWKEVSWEYVESGKGTEKLGQGAKNTQV